MGLNDPALKARVVGLNLLDLLLELAIVLCQQCSFCLVLLEDNSYSFQLVQIVLMILHMLRQLFFLSNNDLHHSKHVLLITYRLSALFLHPFSW